MSTSRTTRDLAALLLAPLPTDEEPVISKNFRSTVHWEMRDRWKLAKAALDLACAQYVALPSESRNRDNARNLVVNAEIALLRTPAPTLVELKWKRRRIATSTRDNKTMSCIARDEAFHAVWSAHKL